MRGRGGPALLVRHTRGQGRAMRWLAVWSAVEAAPTLVSGLLLARSIDRGFLAGQPLVGLAWLSLLAAIQVVGAVATRQVYPWLAATVEPLRDSLVTEVVAASLEERTEVVAVSGEERTDLARTGGATVSQVTEQVEAVRALLATAIRSTRQLLAAGVAALVGLFLLSPPLAAVITPFVFLGLLAFRWCLRVQTRRYRRVIRHAEAIGETAATIVEGVRDVVACGAEERAARTIAEAVDAQAETLRSFARSGTLRLPVLTLGVHLPLLGLLALSPRLVSSHALTPGEVAGAVSYLVTGLQPAVTALVDAGGTLLLSLAVILSRLAEITSRPAEVTSRPDKATSRPDEATVCPVAPAEGVTTVRPGSYDITITDLDFAYSPHAAPIFADLSLSLPEGTHLAVVGPSGAGKSTLANLLTGLATPGHGEIRLGGVPLSSIAGADLRRMMTLIPQEAYVFAGPLRDNLAYLRPDATTAEIHKAVDAVGLTATAERLGGLDAEIPPGGGSLSQGERQLITLTRAYLSATPVVILDEAASHLQPAAEARAEEALAGRGGTLIVIAHRISSAQRADQVFLVDGPHPVLGTHSTLLRHSGLYAELVGHWRQ